MSRNLDIVVGRILEREGGIADVGDGKGVTRFGQTPQWLEAHGFPAPETPEQAAANYGRWLARTRIAEVIHYDVTLGDLLADFATHSGEDAAISALQRVLRVLDDGVIGPITLAALRKHPPHVLARKFLAERLRFIGNLLASTKTDRRVWARGWCNRIADQIETLT